MRLGDVLAANPQVTDPNRSYAGGWLWLPEASAERDRPTAEQTDAIDRTPPNRVTAAPRADPALVSGLSAPATIDEPAAEGLALPALTRMRLEERITLPSGATARVDVDDRIYLPDDIFVRYDDDRRTTTTKLQQQGHSVAWAMLKGAVTLEANPELDASGAGLALPVGAAVDFELVRPFTYDRGGKLPVATMLALPLTAAAAQKLEPGSSFTLHRRAEVGVEASRDENGVELRSERDLSVTVRRHSKYQLEIVLTTVDARTIGLRGRSDAGEAPLEPSWRGQRGRTVEHTFVLDLSKPMARAMYEALLAGKLDEARHAAVEAGSGVEERPVGGLTDRTEKELRLATIIGLTEVGGGVKRRARFEVGVRELGEGKLEVQITRARSATASGRLKESGGDALRIGVNAESDASDEVIDRLVVDPKQPGVMPAIEALREGDAAPMTHLLRAGASGVQLEPGYERHSRTRKADLKATLKEDDWVLSGRLRPSRDFKVLVETGSDGTCVVTLVRTKTLMGDGAAGDELDERLSGRIDLDGVRGSETTSRMRFDLEVPAAKAAMDAMLRGDAGPAEQLAGQPASGVALLEKGDEEQWSGHSVRAKLSYHLENGFNAGMILREEKLSERDTRLTSNRLRTRINEEAAKRGEPIEWHAVGGALEPGFDTSVGTGATAFGFSSNAMVEFYALAPGRTGERALRSAGDLPLDGARARELPVGSEVVLRGKGSVALRVDAGEKSITIGSVEAGYELGVAARADTSTSIGLRVMRLGGNTARVTIGEEQEAGAETGFEAWAGLRVARDDMPGLDSSYFARAAGQAARAVASGLTKHLQVSASAAARDAQVRKQIAAYDFDLSKQGAREAYEKLMRLDARAAAALAAQPGSGVKRVGTSRERNAATSSGLAVNLFGHTVLESQRERRQRNAMLVDDRGTTAVLEHELKLTHEGPLRRGEVRWQALRLENGQRKQKERFLRLSLTELEDEWTSHQELHSLERFISRMGAKVTQRSVENDDPSWWDRHINPRTHGMCTVNADVYFSEEGIAHLRRATREQAIAAFASSLQAIEGSERPLPWTSGDAKYADHAQWLIERYESLGGHGGGDENLDQQYADLTGRTLSSDAESYKMTQDFTAFIERAREGTDEQLFAAYTDLGNHRGFEAVATVGAMAALMPSDAMWINHLSVTGERVTILTEPESGRRDLDVAGKLDLQAEDVTLDE